MTSSWTGLVPVGPAGKLPDTALEAHDVGLLLLLPVVGNGDGEAGVQKGLLPHALVENLIVVNEGVEHLRVRLEGNLGAGVIRGAHDLHFLGDVAPGKLHFVDVPVFVDPDPEPLGQGVDNGRAHAMKAAGDLIAAAAELAAGMKHGVHHFQGRPAGLGLDIHGDTTTVVGNGDGIAGIDGNGDVLAVPGQGFINGVVHDFVDQMMQAGRGGGADIHTGPLPDRFQSFQHLDLLRAVFLSYFGFVRHFVLHSRIDQNKQNPHPLQAGEGFGARLRKFPWSFPTS